MSEFNSLDNLADEVFNIFDFLVRLLPGILTISIWFLIANDTFSEFFKTISSIKYVALFVGSYTLGTVLDVISKCLDRILLNKLIYSDSPRNVYFNKIKRKIPVLRYQNHREKAIKIASDITKKKKSDLQIDDYAYSFSYMVNYLETKNLSRKSDRMMAISEMCRVMTVGVVFGLIGQLVLFRLGYAQELSGTFWVFIDIIPLMIITICLYYNKIRFQRTRFQTVINTYYISVYSNAYSE